MPLPVLSLIATTYIFSSIPWITCPWFIQLPIPRQKGLLIMSLPSLCLPLKRKTCLQGVGYYSLGLASFSKLAQCWPNELFSVPSLLLWFKTRSTFHLLLARALGLLAGQTEAIAPFHAPPWQAPGRTRARKRSIVRGHRVRKLYLYLLMGYCWNE